MGGLLIAIFSFTVMIFLIFLVNKSRGIKKIIYNIIIILMMFTILFGIVIAITPEIFENDITLVYSDFFKLVPVNGYYIYDGNYVLEDNTRGKKGKSSIIESTTLAVSDLAPTANVYIEKRTTLIKPTFWHFSAKIEKEFITFKNDNKDTVKASF